MKIRVKVYIDKYDVQGEDVEIDTDNIKSKQEWNKKRQALIDDFIKKFNTHFKNKYKMDFEDFGRGVYKDNKLNRKLNRVGMQYDKAKKLKDKLKEINLNKTHKIKNEGSIIDKIKPKKYRKWSKEEIDFITGFLKVKRIKHQDYSKISESINRTIPAIKSKLYRLRKVSI